jgi:hypothetical protein
MRDDGSDSSHRTTQTYDITHISFTLILAIADYINH